MSALLTVTDLKTSFSTDEGVSTPVDVVSFQIAQGETLALVGESGCGKTQTALSIMRLIPSPPGRIESGQILFAGRNLLDLDEQEMQSIRGNQIAMVFQEPMTSLNPVFTIGMQISEVLKRHKRMSKAAARERSVELLRQVGIPSPEKRVGEYPYQLSGGMRQRVMIAMALACNPQLLIADEPTTALDVTIQAQILELIRQLKHDLNMAVLLITHDLGVVAEMASRVAVMYAGRVVEEADTLSLFRYPLHPYTQGLLASIPRLDQRTERLHVIEGSVPNLLNLPTGCRFRPRCPYASERCVEEQPKLRALAAPTHKVSCWHPLREREA